jgi:hypothetical protein
VQNFAWTVASPRGEDAVVKNIPQIVVRETIRGVGKARKQAQRGAKLARYFVGRVRSVEKSLFFHLRDTRAGQALLQVATSARGGRELRERRDAAAAYVRGAGELRIDPAKGYAAVSLDVTNPEIASVLATSRQVFEQKQAQLAQRLAGLSAEKQAKLLSGKMSFYRHLLKDDDLRRNPALVDFALSDMLLRPVTAYLGMVPYLTRVDLVYSVSRGTEERIESQLFHLDHEGLRQVKYFIYVNDVGDAEGPFTFLPADTSFRVVNDVRAWRRQHASGRDVESRRYLDSEVSAVDAAGDIVTVKGPAGSGVAVDTSRCLHLGSRVRPGAFRLVLYLQYCTTREITNIFDAERYRGDHVKHLAVAHSVEAGRASADKYEMGG